MEWPLGTTTSSSRMEPLPTSTKVTWDWFTANLSGSWSKGVWSPCSPDCNTLDYCLDRYLATSYDLRDDGQSLEKACKPF